MGARLAEVLPRTGYTECSRAFFKPVKPLEKRDLVQVLEVPATPPAVIDAIRKLEVAMLNLDQSVPRNVKFIGIAYTPGCMRAPSWSRPASP